jgi:predicted nucleic acid-binding protein
VKLFTSQLVIAEVHRFLLFHVGIQAAAVALDRISASQALAIEYTTSEHHRAARAWLEKLDDQVISYTDAVSFSLMTETRCEVALSFDEDFVIAGFERLREDML